MPSQTVQRARVLRRDATEPELILWQHLRKRRLTGWRFRRQHPIGPYVLDFYCPARKLAVEVDGSGHAESIEPDASRSRWLGTHGIRVLRFWNHEVTGGIEQVLEVIDAALAGGDAGGA